MTGFNSEQDAAAALLDAVNQWSTMKFFPREQRAAVIAELARLIRSRESLEWLVPALLYSTGEWPGLREVRALYCTRFTPADRVDIPVCNLPGYTPEENERRYIEQHEQRRALELATPIRPESAKLLQGIGKAMK